MGAADWIAFWDSKHPIYVSARHEHAHFQRIAKDIAAALVRALGPKAAQSAVLDYGCGEALSADLVGAGVGHLTLSDPAPHVLSDLARRMADNARVSVATPEAVAAMPGASFDAVVMHSVSQYLTGAELDALLARFRHLLRPGGVLIVGDVIPRRLPALSDAAALLRFGLAEGFFTAALVGLARTYFSDYRQLRKSLGLARYDEAEAAAKMSAAGFEVARFHPNIGHNNARMTFLARRR